MCRTVKHVVLASAGDNAAAAMAIIAANPTPIFLFSVMTISPTSWDGFPHVLAMRPGSARTKTI
jgi:hypothetical protein